MTDSLPSLEEIARAIEPDWFGEKDGVHPFDNYPGQHREYQKKALIRAQRVLDLIRGRSKDGRRAGCRYHDCRDPYRGELMVADSVRAEVADGKNLLCPTCLMNRIVDRGIWTAAVAQDVDNLLL